MPGEPLLTICSDGSESRKPVPWASLGCDVSELSDPKNSHATVRARLDDAPATWKALYLGWITSNSADVASSSTPVVTCRDGLIRPVGAIAVNSPLWPREPVALGSWTGPPGKLRQAVAALSGTIKRDFQAIDLRNVRLNGADLSEMNLDHAIFSGCTANGVDLHGSSLRYVDMTKCDLTKANLQRANLCFADFRGANLSRVLIEGANLRGADCRHTRFQGFARKPTDSVRVADVLLDGAHGFDPFAPGLIDVPPAEWRAAQVRRGLVILVPVAAVAAVVGAVFWVRGFINPNPTPQDQAVGLIRTLIAQDEALLITTAVVVTNLTTGDTLVEHNGTVVQPAGGINTLPIVLLLLKDLRARRIGLTTEVAWATDDVRGGRGAYDLPGAPHRATVRELIEDMLQQSGNTATAVLVNTCLDGAAAVNARLARILRIAHTSLQSLGDKQFGLGHSDASDALWVLRQLLAGRDPISAVIQHSLATNSFTKFGVRSELPPHAGLEVANSVGNIDAPHGSSRHDVGIISGPAGERYGYSFMTTSPTGAVADRAAQSLGQIGGVLLELAGIELRPVQQRSLHI